MAEAKDAATFELKELVGLLTKNLEPEQVGKVLRETAQRLKIEGDTYNREQALQILDDVSAGSGVLAIVSRFVKARLLLAQVSRK